MKVIVNNVTLHAECRVFTAKLRSKHERIVEYCVTVSSCPEYITDVSKRHTITLHNKAGIQLYWSLSFKPMKPPQLRSKITYFQM